MSCRTLIYKGMLTPRQVTTFYPDLSDPLVESAIAVVHSRFSTNTFPSWGRAHPYRYLIHNGEINTLRGNENWMHARQGMLASDLFGRNLNDVFPIIQDDGSDSTKFDNCLEFLALSGRSLPHAMMMMIPEPWENHESMDEKKRAFYEYHSCLMEPWDGPASIGFTDGAVVGAVLDRNGLRPSRYYVTKDDLVVMASEVGVLEVEPGDVVCKSRLEPGRMLLVDTVEGRIVADSEIKEGMAAREPYKKWLEENLLKLDDLPEPDSSRLPVELEHDTLLLRQRVHGYTREDVRLVVRPMAQNGEEAVGSMGNDTPLAVLSDRPQLLFNYFRQLFAQVTNPAIDPIRERFVMSLGMNLGPQGNVLDETPEHARQLRLDGPVLTAATMGALRALSANGLRLRTLAATFRATDGPAALAP